MTLKNGGPLSQREWERRAAASLEAAQERRRRTHADPVSIAAWAGALLIALAFWGTITLLAITLL